MKTEFAKNKSSTTYYYWAHPSHSYYLTKSFHLFHHTPSYYLATPPHTIWPHPLTPFLFLLFDQILPPIWQHSLILFGHTPSNYLATPPHTIWPHPSYYLGHTYPILTIWPNPSTNLARPPHTIWPCPSTYWTTLPSYYLVTPPSPSHTIWPYPLIIFGHTLHTPTIWPHPSYNVQPLPQDRHVNWLI